MTGVIQPGPMVAPPCPAPPTHPHDMRRTTCGCPARPRATSTARSTRSQPPDGRVARHAPGRYAFRERASCTARKCRRDRRSSKGAAPRGTRSRVQGTRSTGKCGQSVGCYPAGAWSGSHRGALLPCRRSRTRGVVCQFAEYPAPSARSRGCTSFFARASTVHPVPGIPAPSRVGVPRSMSLSR